MTWIKLFKLNSIEQGLKPKKLSNGLTTKPALTGFNQRQIRWAMHSNGLPNIFKRSDIIDNPYSTYHKFPKGILKDEKNYILKVSKIRAGIASAIEKTEKFKQERVNNKKYKGLNKQFMDAMPFLAGKYTYENKVEKEVVKAKSSNKAVSVKTKFVRKDSAISRSKRRQFNDLMERSDTKTVMGIDDQEEILSKEKAEKEKRANLSKEEFRNMRMMEMFRKQKEGGEKKKSSDKDLLVDLSNLNH